MSLAWIYKHAEKLFDRVYGKTLSNPKQNVLEVIRLQTEIIDHLKREFNLEMRIVEVQEELLTKQDEMIKTQRGMIERQDVVIKSLEQMIDTQENLIKAIERKVKHGSGKKRD
jgi:hypothetical protein